mgnify:CR=1
RSSIRKNVGSSGSGAWQSGYPDLIRRKQSARHGDTLTNETTGIIVLACSQRSVPSVADNLIQALEKKVNDLIELSRELNRENRALK